MDSTVDAVLAFASQLGLSESGLSQVSAAFTHNPIPTSVGILILSLLYPSSTFRSGTSEYTTIQQVNWSTRAWLPAALIFTPNSTEEVSTGLKVLTHFSIDFSVRSGGHSTYPGAASSDGGVLISLERLNTLSLSDDKTVVSIGPGNRWGAVYSYLKPFNLATVGGRVPDVGVGGFLTGGGNSFYSGTHGLGCDNVRSYEVVLADGSVVTASADQHSRLFKALKGGSNNFGIVTRFDMYTIPGASDIWGGLLSYTPDKYAAIVDTLVDFQKNKQPLDSKAALIPCFLWNPAAPVCLMFSFHQDTENPTSLSGFRDVGPSFDTTKKTTLQDLVVDTYPDLPEATPLRHDFRTLTIGVDAELYNDAVALLDKTYSPLSAVKELEVVLTFQPIAMSTIKRGEDMGGNVLGVEAVPQTWICFTTTWADSADDQVLLSASITFLDTVAKMAEKKGLLYDFLYLNDAAGDQKVLESYGEDNVRFLKEVAAEYDPEGLFQRIGGFKLPFGP